MLISAKEAKKQAEINAMDHLQIKIKQAIRVGKVRIVVPVYLVQAIARNVLQELGYRIIFTEFTKEVIISWD